jgi:hypothetical protein
VLALSVVSTPLGSSFFVLNTSEIYHHLAQAFWAPTLLVIMIAAEPKALAAE